MVRGGHYRHSGRGTEQRHGGSACGRSLAVWTLCDHAQAQGPLPSGLVGMNGVNTCQGKVALTCKTGLSSEYGHVGRGIGQRLCCGMANTTPRGSAWLYLRVLEPLCAV